MITKQEPIRIHLGVVTHYGELVKVFTSLKQNVVLYDINCWFANYLNYINQPIQQLPPLDDWHHSEEDDTYWEISFPEDEWTVYIHSRVLEE